MTLFSRLRGVPARDMETERGSVVTLPPPGVHTEARLRPLPVALLPRPFLGLIDRQDELHRVSTGIEIGATIEIYGPPGIGKTALLRHLATVAAFPMGSSTFASITVR